MFEENSINGEIRFMNYDLAMLSRQSIKLYTDIFIIIGLNNLYKELNTLVAVGASCFSKTESITYLCTVSPTKNDTFIHTFSNVMINQLNSNSKQWVLFSAVDTKYGTGKNAHVRTLITLVTTGKKDELNSMQDFQDYSLMYFQNIKNNCQKHVFVQRPQGFTHDTNISAITLLINYLKISKCSICLEFGCGYPVLSFCLASVCKSVDAVDIDEAMNYLFQIFDILITNKSRHLTSTLKI